MVSSIRLFCSAVNASLLAANFSRLRNSLSRRARELLNIRRNASTANPLASLCTLAREKAIYVQRQIGHQAIVMGRQVKPG